MQSKAGVGRRIWRLIYPVLTYLGVAFLVGMAFSVVFVIQGMSEYGMDIEAITAMTLEKTYQYSNLLSAIAAAAAIPLMLLFMHMDKKRSYREGWHETYDRAPIVYYVTVFFFGFVAAITANNLISISGLANIELELQEELAEIIYSGGIVIEVLSVVILGPVLEELIFRGLIFRRMRERSSFAFSMVFSALFFAVFHGNVVQGVYAFMLGLLMAFVCERFKSIVAPILFHMGANAFSVVGTETKLLDFVEKSNAAALLYIAAGAALTLILMWIVYEKVHPKLLIPAASAQQEEPGM